MPQKSEFSATGINTSLQQPCPPGEYEVNYELLETTGGPDMIDIVCIPRNRNTENWALILAFTARDLDDIIAGAHCVYPVSTHPGHDIVPCGFLCCLPEVFENTDMMALSERVYDMFPNLDSIIPIMLDDEVIRRIQLGDWPTFSASRLGENGIIAHGWENLDFIELRYGKDDDEIISTLEGAVIDQGH